MPAQSFVENLHAQIANEFAASHQYVAIAVYYESQTLPRLANLFYKQALEERNHALMMVAFLLDRGYEVSVPGIDPPRSDFAHYVDPIAIALQQERDVSAEIE